MLRTFVDLLEMIMPSDRVQKKITNYADIFGKKCIDYAENTLDYAEISTVNKTEHKAFRMYRTTVEQNALQILTHNLSSVHVYCSVGICGFNLPTSTL